MKKDVKILAIFFSFLIASFSLVGCGDQSSPEIDDANDGRDRIETCSDVSYSQDFLEHKNILNFFECTNWNKTFPHLYESMTKVKTQNWNHLARPFNKEFFNNKKKRNQFFKLLKNLDKENALDDLSRVVNSLNETNFYDAIRDLLVCSEASVTCPNRDPVLTREEVVALLDILKIQPKTVKLLSGTVGKFNKAIKPHASEFREKVLKLINKETFDDLRLFLISSIADEVKDGIDSQSETLLENFFLAVDENGLPFLYSWMKRSGLTANRFEDLIQYPIGSDGKRLILESRVINKNLGEGVVCKKPARLEREADVVFDLNNATKRLMENVRDLGVGNFENYTLEMINAVKVAEPFCPSVTGLKESLYLYEDGENENIEVNMGDVYLRLLRLFNQDAAYPMLGHVVNSITTDDQEDLLFLLKLVDTKALHESTKMLSFIKDNSPGYWKTLYEVFDNLLPEFYEYTGAGLERTFNELSGEVFKSQAKSWLFYNKTEKGFILNLIDTHFAKDTNYPLLFSFYSDVLYLMADVIPAFDEDFNGTMEDRSQTFMAVKEMATNFAGDDTLRDFSRLLSRDYIMKIIKIITRGVVIDEVELAEKFNRGRYLDKIQRPSFPLKREDTNESVVKCAEYVLKEGSSFYDLILEHPPSCMEVTEKSTMLKFFGWLESIEREFTDFSKENQGQLFGKTGIVSPAMLGESILNMDRFIIAYNRAAQEDLRGPDHAIQSLMNLLTPSGKHEFNLFPELEKTLKLTDQFMTLNETPAVIWRNNLIRDFSRAGQEGRLKSYSRQSHDILREYTQWEKRREYERPQVFSAAEKYRCNNYLNMEVNNTACPSVETVKKKVNRLIALLRRKNEKGRSSGIELLIQAASPEGIQIPLNYDQSRSYHLSLKKTAEVLYDLSEKSFQGNRENIVYRKQGQDPVRTELTTIERIETVIREVWFDGNYLGAHYQNSVAQANDYNDVVRAKRSLLTGCIPFRFCGKFMDNDEHRMAKNSDAAFDGLLDANKIFGHGDYMTALLSVIVGSSSEVSSRDHAFEFNFFGKTIRVPFIPTKAQLRKHNGEILTRLADVSFFSNVGRLLHDRVGRTVEGYEEFLNRKDFARASQAFLKGFDQPAREKNLRALLKSLQETKNNKGKTLIDETIDWISSLDYGELRILENSLARFLVVSSYLGPLTDVEASEGSPYKNNSLYFLVEHGRQLVGWWPHIHRSWAAFAQSTGVEFIDVVAELNDVTRFFQHLLENEEEEVSELAWNWLNETYLLGQRVLLEPGVSDIKGADLLGQALTDFEWAKGLLANIRNWHSYFASFDRENQSEERWNFFLRLWGEINEEQVLNFNSMFYYLNMTSQFEICAIDGGCEENTHYDEPFRLLEYAMAPSSVSGEETKLERGLNILLKKNKKEITQLIREIVPVIESRPAREDYQF